MKSFKADYVFPVFADPIKNGIVTVDDDGKIINITDKIPPESHSDDIIHLNGVICPGFINTHCHLELSHLHRKITAGGGLVKFIKEVQSLRNTDPDEIYESSQRADNDMYESGIVAVGDICNSNITIEIKAKSKIRYHSFIETFGFLPERAQAVFDNAMELANQFKPQSCSITPHAPYSVSKELFRLIRKHSDNGRNLLSMHNQESEEENKFYRYKSGDILDLYDHFDLNIDHFKPQARNSIQSIIPLLTNKQDILLVHNTTTNLKDIYFIKRFDRKIHWCFCPSANLYIENRLPKVDLFLDQGFNITIGTDSLASNSKLSILEEMRVLQQNFPLLGFETLLEWATINGAKFLGIDGEKGTLERKVSWVEPNHRHGWIDNNA
jgi:cytosine/adenosine deaminase-related metal-dependent hydrolase